MLIIDVDAPLLGRGTFGDVYHARIARDEELVPAAAKIMQSERRFVREVRHSKLIGK
jgi:hypothetical protein